ncbi:MAG: hypothetical protein QNJ67_18440 [Kiloniellales bacterium]|nr:hypothetical protein [Kiloniellales bacterium]
MARLLAALAALAALLTLPATASAQLELRANFVESYFPDFPVKRKMNQRYRPRLNDLHEVIHERMEAGENLTCSAQIFEEAHWLVNYTDRAEDIERRIADLEKSLEPGGRAAAPIQDPADGSFSPCSESWIWRFHNSVDPLKELAQLGEQPEFPLKFWEKVDTPEEIEALMRDLLISDARSDHNKRKELNLAITALGQLLWLDYTVSVFPDHLDRDLLANTLTRFVDEEWQDLETGYWGAWYRDEGEIKKTNDLSITFHIISYRGGQVGLLEQIGNTTFAIRTIKYPYGWSTGGTQNNHHAYDVARIINLTWDHLDGIARAYAGTSMFLMMARSLGLSIDGNGRFDPRPYTTVAEAYYFGISFFEELGYFGNETPRDQTIVISDSDVLLRRIEEHLLALDQSDPWVAASKRKLARIKEIKE